MLINIDAGHGYDTAGKRTPPMPEAIDINGDKKNEIKKGEQYREHVANVGVAVLLVDELQRCGFKTMQTGFDDVNASDDPDQALAARQKAIAKANCDFSISIHFNAYGDGKTFNAAQGIGVFIHDRYAGQSEKLAQSVLKYLTGGTKQTNRGVKKQSLAMCNCNNMDTKAAILCELAFMTNEHEAVEMMANEGYWKERARGICQGVCEYTGIKYIPEINTPSRAITTESDPKNISWAQEALNAVLPAVSGLIPLTVNGVYNPDTRLAVLLYWRQLGWDKDMADDGTKIGIKTINALATKRIN